jgi:cytochrome c-type biogenesis protein CcmE
MTRKQRRFSLIAAALLIFGGAIGAILYGFSASVTFFNSPSDVVEKKLGPGTRLRLGGLVETGTLEKSGVNARFTVTDGKNAVKVTYTGILPDLFREGQGVVTEGVMEPGGQMRADTVLAKHDENYMPREVVDALKRSGEWKPEAAKAGKGGS